MLEIERVGDWGEVTYRHRLSCGHTDVRKRPAPAPQVSCVLCAAEQSRPAPPKNRVVAPDLDLFDPWDDGFATSESEVAQVRAGIAARFGVPNDAVDAVVSASGELSYVLVFLDAAAARRLA